MLGRLRIEVASDPADRAAVGAAAEAFVRARGVGDEGVGRIDRALPPLLTWAADRAYPDGSVGRLEVQLRAVEGGLDVRISDLGHPAADFGGAAGPVPAELISVSELTRELRQVNLADRGTRLSAVIAVTGLRPSAPAGSSEPYVSPPLVTPDEIGIRDGQPGDAPAIVDLIFASYGLSYAHPEFYRADWIAEQMSAGRVLSTVAVFHGEVIGHHALLVTDPGAAVETAVVVVDPAFRGLGIVSNHLAQVLGRAVDVSAPAILSRAVTHHPYTQMAEQSLGFHTTGLMFGAATYEGHPRSAVTIAYLLLDRRPHVVSLPTMYAAAVLEAFANAGIEPTERRADAGTEPGGGAIPVATETSGLGVMPGTVVITISGWGEEPRVLLESALRSVVRSDDRVMYADVDLETLSVAELDEVVAMLREYDFFYCGLVLFGPRGHDHLRLQSMLTDNVQVDGLTLVGEYAGKLYAGILADAGPALRSS